MLTLKRLIGAATSGVALALALVSGPAAAKTYPGSFTPPFGYPFEDLEWSGSGDFFIPDACEAGSNGWKANAGATCGGQTITNGKLVFSSLTNSFADEVFTFTLPTVNAMYIDNHQLRGVDSEFIGHFQSANFHTVDGHEVWFWLKFEHEIAVGDNRSIVQLYYNEVGEGSSCLVAQNCAVWGQSENKAILTIVPEPSTYALMGAGLLTLFCLCRRRTLRL